MEKELLIKKENKDCNKTEKRKTFFTKSIFVLLAIFGLVVYFQDKLPYLRSKIKYYSPICNIAPLYPEDRRQDKNQFVFMNYNAEWLFLNGGSGKMKCPGKCTWKNQGEAERHFENISKVVRKFNPDIVHFSEVEGCEVLEQFSDQFNDYKHYLVKGTDSITGQNVGLVTKIDPNFSLMRSAKRQSFPIEESTCSSTSGTTAVSKHYITRFELNGKNVLLIGVHFVAFPNLQRRCIQREAQAKFIKDLILEYRRSGEAVIVSGDFNDFDNDFPGADGQESISQTLKILKSGKGDHVELFNIHEYVERKDRYSAWYDKNNNCIDDGVVEHSLLDHILVTRDLFDMIVRVEFEHDYSASCLSKTSDHWPIIVTFKLD